MKVEQKSFIHPELSLNPPAEPTIFNRYPVWKPLLNSSPFCFPLRYLYLSLFSSHVLILTPSICALTEGAENVALGRPAYQSSDQYEGVADRAVDGDDNPNFVARSCTHTATDGSSRPWWAVDLQWRRTVATVTLTNRHASVCKKNERLESECVVRNV